MIEKWNREREQHVESANKNGNNDNDNNGITENREQYNDPHEEQHLQEHRGYDY